MSNARREHEKHGKVTSVVQQLPDEFAALCKDRTKEPARVSVGLSQSAEFGAIKVSATVTLTCDQTQKAIDAAGGAAYNKAFELLQDGWHELQSDIAEAQEAQLAEERHDACTRKPKVRRNRADRN